MHTERPLELKDVVASLSMHGLPRSVTSKTCCGRTFWLVVWLIFFVGFVFQVNKLVKKYRDFQVYRKVTTKASDHLEFPALTICNTNIFNFGDSADTSSFPPTCDSSVQNSEAVKNNYSLQSPVFLRGCSMFLSNLPDACKLNGLKICQFPRGFQPVKNYHQCYTYRGNSSLKQEMSGGPNGLQMIIFLNDSDFTHSSFGSFSLAYNTNMMSDSRKGIQILIHPDSVYPVGYNLRPATAPVGYCTEIIIKLVVMKRKKSPHPSNCSENGNPSYEKLFPGKYTHNHCIVSCFYLGAYEECGFVLDEARLWMPDDKFPKRENKTFAERRQCLSHFTKEFKPAAKCDCPLLCYELSYRYRASRYPWPQRWKMPQYSKYFAKALNIASTDVNETYVRNNFLMLDVFFEDFTYEEITEEAVYDGDSLMSDVGGHLGLLLGASIISVIEFIWLLLRVIIKKPKRKQQHITSVQPIGDICSETQNHTH